MREREDRFESDVYYEVWRCGGNPDAISPDELQDQFWSGQTAHDAAMAELRSQRPQQARLSEDEYYEEMRLQLEGGTK